MEKKLGPIQLSNKPLKSPVSSREITQKKHHKISFHHVVIILVIGASLAYCISFVFPPITLKYLIADKLNSFKKVDAGLETTIVEIAKKEMAAERFTWSEIKVTQRTQKGVKILELTIREYPKNNIKFQTLFDSLKSSYSKNPEIKKAFQGFELNIIGVGHSSRWDKFSY